MKKVIAIFTILAGLQVSMAAQSSVKTDGSFWNSLKEDLKLGYAMGFLEGVHFGDDVIVVGFASVGSDFSTLAKSQTLYAAYLKEHFDEINVKQVTDGLNSFYSDYRNRNIEMSKAVWVIAHEIASTPRADIELMTEGLRRGVMKEPPHK